MKFRTLLHKEITPKGLLPNTILLMTSFFVFLSISNHVTNILMLTAFLLSLLSFSVFLTYIILDLFKKALLLFIKIIKYVVKCKEIIIEIEVG